LLRLLLQPTLAAAIDHRLEGFRLISEIVFNQQVLREGQQQSISAGIEAGLQQSVETLLLAPDAAQHQHPLRCGCPNLGQHRWIAGAHLEQQLIWSAPELAFAHDSQEEWIALLWVVLDALGRRVGTAAGDHHRLIAIQQERRGDVLPSEGGQRDGIHCQIAEQVMGQRGRGVQVTVFGVDDQRQIARHQVAHLQQQLQSERTESLVEAEAGLDRADVGAGFLYHRLDPVTSLA